MTISIFGTGVIDSEDAKISLANTALLVPTGNTLQRPSPAFAGMLRFNSQLNLFEFFNGAGWNYVASQFNVTYLVVGGGGGGTNYGGGGAGGLLTSSLSLDSNRTANITVGSGGAGAASAPLASNGSPSSFIINNSLTQEQIVVTSFGGGKGGSGASSGFDGGSGGGGGYGPGVVGGTGTVGQGNSGGSGGAGTPAFTAGGGGGSGQAGAPGTPTTGGFGGNGILISWFTGAYGDPAPDGRWFAGGGGGGNFAGPGAAVNGGIGGGGKAGKGGSGALSGNVNTGGGGGGAGNTPVVGGSGGSGIVILSHSNTLGTFVTTGSPNVTNSGGNIFYVFTQSGTINFGAKV